MNEALFLPFSVGDMLQVCRVALFTENFPIEGKTLQNKGQYQKKGADPKEQDCENHSQGSEQEI